MVAGQPTSYEDQYPEQARKLVELGATDLEVAEFFGVTVRTIYNWKHNHPEFFHALKRGKEHADATVEKSLFERATGYTIDSIKIFCDKDGNVTKVPFQEHVAPDTTAMIFWLKNRKPAEWRDKIDHEHSGSIDLAGTLEAARKRAEGE